MATDPPGELTLTPLKGEGRTVEEWLTVFHLVSVVVDPYTNESAWVLDVAARILRDFSDAAVRVNWIVTADADDARAFLGPLASEFLTFADPDRDAVKALGLERLPGLRVHPDGRHRGGVDRGLGPGGVAHGGRRHRHGGEVVAPGDPRTRRPARLRGQPGRFFVGSASYSLTLGQSVLARHAAALRRHKRHRTTPPFVIAITSRARSTSSSDSSPSSSTTSRSVRPSASDRLITRAAAS